MTAPEADDADRQEQATAVTGGGPEPADEVRAPADDVPEADALEQQLTAAPGGTGTLGTTDVEANEADVLEQQAVVPDDEDELRD